MKTRFPDCHMHSSFSADSDAPMEEMIRKALSEGLPGICFTEHLDPDYPDTPEHLDFSLDLDTFRDTLFALREKYEGRIRILYGIELGLQPHLGPLLSSITAAEPFDFVIGSSHVLDGADPYYPSFFEGKREEDVCRRYFETELECVRAFSGFDVYGHLDYIVRYCPSGNGGMYYGDCRDILDTLLREIISRGIGLEMNTGGCRYGAGLPNPSPEILTRYRELGGEIITLGADAHSPERIAFCFDRVQELLEQCGFRYFTVFENRRPVFYPIQ